MGTWGSCVAGKVKRTTVATGGPKVRIPPVVGKEESLPRDDPERLIPMRSLITVLFKAGKDGMRAGSMALLTLKEKARREVENGTPLS